VYIPKDNVTAPLYVVTSIFNSARFKSRYKLYRDFAAYVKQSGAILVTIEAAFGDRTYALEDHATVGPPHNGLYQSFGPAPNPPSASLPHSRAGQDYIKVRADQMQEIWLKENLQNLAVQHLPEDAKYIAFIDADVRFARPDWVSETLHSLQHYDVTQMFSTAIDLSPDYEPLMLHRSFGYSYLNGETRSDDGYSIYGDPHSGKANVAIWHPGFAWAWKKSALDAVGGLIDWGVTGSNDHHMSKCLIGKGPESYDNRVSPAYKAAVLEWQARAVGALQKNVGYVEGTLHHYWHGRKIARGYKSRWQILIDSQYDPKKDIIRDWRGLYKLTGNKPKLRDDLRAYFKSRDEDDVFCPDEDQTLL